jgi:argininosuccinate lyase
VLALLWPRLGFDAAAMRAAAGGFALATDLAEYLVRHGVAFRRAHEIVGALVREASAAGRSLEDFSLADLRRHNAAFGRDVLRGLTAEGSVRARNLPGGPAAAAMRRYLRRLERR